MDSAHDSPRRAIRTCFLLVISLLVLIVLGTGNVHANVTDLLCRRGSLITTVRGNVVGAADGTTIAVYNENNAQIAPTGSVVVDERFLVTVPNADPATPSVGDMITVDVTGNPPVMCTVEALTNWAIILGTFFCDPIGMCEEPATADQLGFQRGHVDPGQPQRVRVYLERPPAVADDFTTVQFAVSMTQNLTFQAQSDTYCGIVAGVFPNVQYVEACNTDIIIPIMDMDIDVSGPGVLDILPMLTQPNVESAVADCMGTPYVLDETDVTYMTFFGDPPDCGPVSLDAGSWGSIKARFR